MCFFPIQDVALGGWQLKHYCGDNETSYKFHRTLHLKPQQYVTVSYITLHYIVLTFTRTCMYLHLHYIVLYLTTHGY